MNEESHGVTIFTRPTLRPRRSPSSPTSALLTAQPDSSLSVHWPQQQSTQMSPTMSSYDVCRAAGRALVPRGVAGSCFALAKSHLKSFVEHKGVLSTLERCTGASHRACAHCLRLPRACQGQTPSVPKLPTLLLTFALLFAGAGAVSGLELAAPVLPV